MIQQLKKEKEEKTWNCRFHPTDGWHEVGCPHRNWTKKQLVQIETKPGEKKAEIKVTHTLKPFKRLSNCCEAEIEEKLFGGFDEVKAAYVDGVTFTCAKCGKECEPTIKFIEPVNND